MNRLLTFLVLSLLAVSCSNITSYYTPETDIVFNDKEVDARYFINQPSRKAERIGTIYAIGDSNSSWDDMIDSAQRLAGRKGADYILKMNSGINQKEIFVPASSSFSVDSKSGYGWSTGAYTYTAYSPWLYFSAWRYDND